MVRRLSQEQKEALVHRVLKRDKGRCVIHGTGGAEVHELLFKSSGPKNSALVFRIEYMACLCQEICHHAVHRGAQKAKVTKQVLEVLSRRHGYKYPSKEISRNRQKEYHIEP